MLVAGLATTERTISPTGSGQARRLDNGTVVEFNGMMSGTRWLPDGQQIVFVGREAGRPRRVFLQNVSGGPPRPITPEREFGPMAVSPDSNLVAVGANNPDQRLVVYPLAGGSPTPVAGSEKGDQPLASGRTALPGCWIGGPGRHEFFASTPKRAAAACGAKSPMPIRRLPKVTRCALSCPPMAPVRLRLPETPL